MHLPAIPVIDQHHHHRPSHQLYWLWEEHLIIIWHLRNNNTCGFRQGAAAIRRPPARVAGWPPWCHTQTVQWQPWIIIGLNASVWPFCCSRLLFNQLKVSSFLLFNHILWFIDIMIESIKMLNKKHWVLLRIWKFKFRNVKLRPICNDSQGIIHL